MSRIRVLLAEDHDTVRQGLKLLIDAQPDMTVVADVSNGRQALERARTLAPSPDVAVLDVAMPELNGLSTTRAMIEVLPGVALTQHIGDLSRLAESPPDQFRLILGYAGWGEGQLMEEILRNDWLTAPASSELIFAPDPEQIWGAALRSVGIDPTVLPSWIPGRESEDSTN